MAVMRSPEAAAGGGGGGGEGLKLSEDKEGKKEKPFRFTVRKQRRDDIIRADRTDPILRLAPSNLMSGRGAR